MASYLGVCNACKWTADEAHLTEKTAEIEARVHCRENHSDLDIDDCIKVREVHEA